MTLTQKSMSIYFSKTYLSYVLIILSCILILVHPPIIMASVNVNLQEVSHCPIRTGTKFKSFVTLSFSKKPSLWDLKKEIIESSMDKNLFISKYEIDYSPMYKKIDIKIECPRPFMKLQVYKNSQNKNSLQSSSILVEGGMLYDTTYEAFLREDKKLLSDLVYFNSDKELSKEYLVNVISFYKKLPFNFKDRISEFFVNSEGDLIVILSVELKPVSILFGLDNWSEKLNSALRVLNSLERKNKVPRMMNLSNPKKVIVKF